MMRYLGGLALALLITAHASAAEPLTTAGQTADAMPGLGPSAASDVPPLDQFRALPSSYDDTLGPPPGDSAGPAGGAGCNQVADRKPHGQVWAGVGTHGYREVGTEMTAPVGKCGSVSIAVSKTDGGGYRGWRR